MGVRPTPKQVMEKLSVRPVTVGGIRLTAVEADVLLETVEGLLRRWKRREGFLSPERRELLRMAIDNRSRILNGKARARNRTRRAA